MNEDGFRAYLEFIYDNKRVISDCISRCKRVCKFEGNLDQHYLSDEGHELLSRLSYSKEDAELGNKQQHDIPINGTKGYFSIYEGTKSLESAVRKYFEYKKSIVF